MLASKDPLAYQAVQAMDMPMQPTPEGDNFTEEETQEALMARLAQEQYGNGKEDDLDNYERGLINDALRFTV